MAAGHSPLEPAEKWQVSAEANQAGPAENSTNAPEKDPPVLPKVECVPESPQVSKNAQAEKKDEGELDKGGATSSAPNPGDEGEVDKMAMKVKGDMVVVGDTGSASSDSSDAKSSKGQLIYM